MRWGPGPKFLLFRRTGMNRLYGRKAGEPWRFHEPGHHHETDTGLQAEKQLTFHGT